jgi:hypothetical protein
MIVAVDFQKRQVVQRMENRKDLNKYHENLRMFEESRNERVREYVDKLRRELKPGQFIEVLMAIVSPEHFYNVSDRTVLKRVEEYFVISVFDTSVLLEEPYHE